MNDDKDRILQACNSFSAEELFHFIRSGDLTLLDLVRAGLDDNKLVGLQELMAIEEDDLWAEVQTKRTPALCRRYLQAYPNGRYAGRCTKLMLQLADGPTDDRPAPDATPTADQATTPPTPPAPPQPEPATSEEEKLWHEVQTRRTMQLCGRYLQTYPNGHHAEECAEMIARLTKKQNEPKKHTSAAPRAGSRRPAGSTPPAGSRSTSKKLSPMVLLGSTLLSLLLIFLVRQLTTPGSESQTPNPAEGQWVGESCEREVDSTAGTALTAGTYQLLFDEVKQNLLYFHDEQTWDDNMFDATRRNLQILYYQRDEDPTARELLSQIEQDVVRPYYGKERSEELRSLIRERVAEYRFDAFIDRLESQIKKWDRHREENKKSNSAAEPQPRPAPKQKEKKADETKASTPRPPIGSMETKP